jgi:Flp pilus assembly protein protease CpaA
LAATLLFYVAVTDLREFKIRNELIGVLVLLYFAHALVSGRWVSLHWHIGFALLMFSLMLFAYKQNLMGGGDLKLLTVGFLWSGVECAVPFVLILCVFALLHTLVAKRGWVQAQWVNGRIKVAFAPSVAAGLIGIYLSGCLNPT